MTDAESQQQAVTLTADQILQQAIAHHQAGQLQDAERLYRAILQAQPHHPDANHNLGVLAVQVKQPAVALPHFKVALEANPAQGQYWLSYIDALIQASQFDVARQVLDQGKQRGLNGEVIETLVGRLEGLSGNEPGPQERSALVALLTAGRHTEAETHARAMTVRYPLHGFGWKVLGAVFKQAGRSAAALEAMQKAAELLPGDAEAHSNLGAAQRDLGRLDDAVTSCLRALEIRPDLAEVHSNLGNVFHDMGRLGEAEGRYRQALQIRPDYAEAHYALGNTLMNLERLDEAETSYRQALQLKPDYARAHNNLGNTLRELGRLDDAEASCRRALQIRPDYPGAYSNLGVILLDRGLLAEASYSYRMALQIQQDFDEALFNLGQLLRYLDEQDQATAIYQKMLDIAPVRRLDAAVYLAILYYLEGKTEPCRSMLLASNAIVEKPGLEHKNLGVYWRYLDKLMTSHQQPDQGQTQSREPLHVIGESHSLSAHGVVVHHGGQEMRCTAEWIEGCKQWHLGNGKPNKYKHKFEAVMTRLPRQSTILSLIGEIDCRHDEGMIKAWHKSPDKKLEEIARATASAYVMYVGRIAARYGHRMIVGGVPATNMQLDTLAAASAEQLVELIRTFNAVLKKTALAAGMDFLDVYALTDRGDGIATGEWHIDSNHLLPDAVTEAFDRCCIRGMTLHASSAVSQGGKKTHKAKPAKKIVSQKLPGHQEMNALVALFNGGRVAEAETLARLMTARYPSHGFGWKVLGAVLTQLRRGADAVEAMQKAAALSPDDAEARYNLAITLGGLGRLNEAEASYREALQIKPVYAEAHGNLGVLLKGMGRLHEAEASYRRALEIKPDLAEVQNNLGNTLRELGRLNEAEVSFRRALQLKPDYVEAHSNLGNALHAHGRLNEAEASYRRALQLKPDYAEAHSNLGNTLHELGRLEEAEASYRRALQLKPDYAEAHGNLGNTLRELDRLAEAEASYRRAIEFKPDYAEAHINLGKLLSGQGRLDEAQACFEQAATLNTDYAEAYYNLGGIMLSQGRLKEAEANYGRALALVLKIVGQSPGLRQTRDARVVFVGSIRRLLFGNSPVSVRDAMVRALSEPWCQPTVLTSAGCALVKLVPVTGECVVRAASAWPVRLSAQDLFGTNGLATISGDALLNALLISAPICDIEMEHFLTMARHAMLEAATGMGNSGGEIGAALNFYSALARQCFINEYVFAHSDDEIKKAGELRDALVAALESNARMPALWPVAVAAYFPLCSLPVATQLLAVQWPDEVVAVLVQQVREPAEELQIRATIPRLTDIENEVSLLVQSQYEENP